MCVCVFRLREESAREAEEAGKIAHSIGADHALVTLDWNTMALSKKTSSNARHLRYSALMEQCGRLGLNVVMTGHHADDQIGNEIEH